MNEPLAPPAAPVSTPKRRKALLRKVGWAAAVVLVLLVALGFWISSAQFEDLVRKRLQAAVENATGGKTEIAAFHWSPFALEAEADGLVIHGDEQPSDAPYARVARLRVRLSVLGFLSPRIHLRNLEVLQPQLHLIVYPDGATNQPHPRNKQTNRSALDTFFDLKVGHVSVEQGWIDVENRAAALDFQNRYQPLDFQGDDASLLMQHVPASAKDPESFHIEAGVRDLKLTRGGTAAGGAPVRGYLQSSLDLTRNAAYLRWLRLTAHTRGAKDRTLEIKGSLSDFARPHWQATTTGELDMRLLEPVLGYPFAPEGIAHLDLNSAGSNGEFRIDGTVHAEQASYIGTGVVARGVDLTARVHADPLNLRITQIAARLKPGGVIEGEVLLAHWLTPVPGEATMEAATTPQPAPQIPLRKKLGRRFHLQPAPPPPAPPKPHSILVKAPNIDIPVDGKVNANFRNVSVDTILDMVSQPPFQRLGLDSLLNGPATAVWKHGDVQTLVVDARFGMSSSGRNVPNETPTHGLIDATYTQRDGSVDLRTLDLNMAATQIEAHGRLGAYPITSPTNLNLQFKSHNLGELDTALRSLGLKHNGKTGTAALPGMLQGEADFAGTWAGSLTSPRLSGRLNATQLTLEIPSTAPGAASKTVHWDSIEADGSYDAEQIAIVHSLWQRGGAQLALDGTITAPGAPIASKSARPVQHAVRGDEMPGFDSSSVMHAHLRANKVSAADLLTMAGVNVPVSGSLDAQITADGPLHAPGGSGWIQLNDGVVYGEPVTHVRAQGSFSNPVLQLSSLTVNSRAGAIAGSGSYDIHAKSFKGEAHGTGIDLARIEHLQSASLSGKMTFNLSASGTPQSPVVDGHLSLASVSVGGSPVGAIDLVAHTVDHALVYNGTTHLEAAALSLHGRTQLQGDYATTAGMEFSRFNVGALLKLAGVNGIGAESSLAGTATIEGPLAHLERMKGDARLPQMAVAVAGVHLQSDGGLHATLNNARVNLDPVHITGEDTDLHVMGGLALKGDKRLDLAASGSVNLKLAQSVDPDLTASGTTTFQVEAHGPLANPGLRGRVEFQNGALALEDLPNGLSQIHGTLEFNQNRLEVRSMTAMTGGGQLNLGGYLAYQHGLYADLSVTGKSIRIRYPQGVSSLADASLHLQGTQSNLLLSGGIMITRFSVSQDLDIAALASRSSVTQPIAPPNAPSNHVRLDVRIQSSPQLNFQNAYAKLAGDVDLRLRGTLATPSLQGRVSITEGNAVIAGTRYELQRGDITFSNPVRIQPNIDLNATARVEDYDITLSLHGTPDKMSVNYRSDPPLPQADVVALLALGRTQSEQGLYTQQQQQSAGLAPSTDVLLGGALNATVSSRVQKLFGAGAVKVDPSYLGALGNSTTRITVEEQLGKNVTLIYATNVDTSAQQLLQAEVAINRHVSVVMARDESGVFSMVVKATRRYK